MLRMEFAFQQPTFSCNYGFAFPNGVPGIIFAIGVGCVQSADHQQHLQN
jgi:hypothetical protein